ncbi:IS110 family RNA-guided transposase [Cellvibrio polysaccharolyticus]|uniref:IS110 family transposase n=1 Tax=Cellvibrio polysaccharolyticus TaxID=2082724 RepID=A0A928YSN3_9GAMM|nr:IS110 family transposase [Cellvibrio polysaccharolyticus]MBE8715932.1 IS110 family transposase [Cellvibrio polysaccharolyticus]MBE8716304.1 IS110 family transposase [Cellvibrio polysaccharolyticus]MBE8716548.1 IS110 family transposase [Cellvibrio polysaccharolyticus]
MSEHVAVIGVDLAKNVFQVCAASGSGKRLINKKITRAKLLDFFVNLPPCLVGMEACSSAHHWARQIQKLGHHVKLIPPQFVKPYVKSNKNDAADADAICEAVTRPTMRFVAIKSEEQQALLLLHRDRKGLVGERSAIANRLRASLAEFGLIVPVGIHKLRAWLQQDYGAYEETLPVMMRLHAQRLAGRLRQIDQHIDEIEHEIKRYNPDIELTKRLQEVPGIGPLTASALVATIKDGSSFKSGREFSAWLGLVPRQHSSGGKDRLLGISKRGDTYLRTLFIHGARAVIKHMNPRRSMTPWIAELMRRRHRNVVIVALANKLARIAWALMSKGKSYDEAFGF